MDPDLKRLLLRRRENPNGVLSTAEAASVLGISLASIQRLVLTGRLESKRVSGRGRGVRHRNLVSLEACLVYLVRITNGGRTALLGDIEQHAPDWLPLANRVVAEELAPRTRSGLPLLLQPKEPLKTRPARPAADPLQGHLADLFDTKPKSTPPTPPTHE